ncbi:hypothetical protein [Natronorarus salvus]|uniref:hypothetical protein n=1 Tax=Natronorarus salvus TaxID=3117733 RepID=UPI002F26BD1D
MSEPDAPSAAQPDRSLWDRLEVGGLSRWLFLTGDRHYLSALLLALVFAVSLLLIYAGTITPAEEGGITDLSASLIGGMLPFITVVLAINQLILSEEFGTAGTFFERLDETRDFRRTIEDHTGSRPSPVDPAEFLRTLIEAKRRAALGMQNVCRAESRSVQAAVDEYVSSTASVDADAIDTLGEATFGTFAVIAVILDYNDPWQLQVVRRIREDYRHDLTEPMDRQADRVEDLLRDIHIARQYFKTVYMQQELADLSKILLYVGFPTLLGGAFVVLAYDNLLALGLHPWVYAAVVALTITALFSPFAVLLFYVLRIATIARRTAADFGPFVLQKELPSEDRETTE